jgi:hypothetical protein
VNILLALQRSEGSLAEFEWSSAQNAVCPYDFRTRDASGLTVKLDVKSTAGPFENDIHISLGELTEAAEAGERYDLYRIYELREEGGKLRISEDIQEFARGVLLSLQELPAGLKCDGFSISLRDAHLRWSDETYIARPSGDEGDGVL